MVCRHRGPPYALDSAPCARRSPDESSFGACGQADIEQTAYFCRRRCAALWHKGRRCALVGCQVVSDRVRGCVGFAARADLAVDVCDVPRDSAEAEDEFARYFGFGAAAGDEAQDLSFATRKGPGD